MKEKKTFVKVIVEWMRLCVWSALVSNGFVTDWFDTNVFTPDIFL